MTDSDREKGPNFGTDEGFPYASGADKPLSFALKAFCFVLPLVGLITSLVMMKKGRKRGTREAIFAMAFGMAAWYLFGLVMSEFVPLE